MPFKTDLLIGQQAELLLADWYEQRGCKVERANGYHPEWDLAVTRNDVRPFTVEIKHDLKAHLTGNFFIERKCLEHSKADVLVYCYGSPISTLYFLDLPKTLLRLAPHPSDTIGGDQREAGWLFSKRKFEQILKPEVHTVH